MLVQGENALLQIKSSGEPVDHGLDLRPWTRSSPGNCPMHPSTLCLAKVARIGCISKLSPGVILMPLTLILLGLNSFSTPQPTKTSQGKVGVRGTALCWQGMGVGQPLTAELPAH